ncbi:FliH/SctL family protein [Cryobacterium sp. M23]|uniref:FliH/SctL family protein n=1 Tax=Cryobacterium sp. M23 TaxID=2048292 RepID=UPI000CE35078|nr:FliH/SctL family protein [Cryobacterium sp. M23]
MLFDAATARSNFSAVTFPSLQGERDAGGDASRARGHAAGYTAGLRAAAAEVDARIARLDAEQAAAGAIGQARIDRAVALLGAAAAALHERTVPVIQEAEDTLVATALELAEAILGYSLGDADASARAALGRTLATGATVTTGALGTVRPHSVRMNPADLALIDLITRADAGVDFTADADLARGDAIAEFPDGFLDARIGTALTRAKAALTGARS